MPKAWTLPEVKAVRCQLIALGPNRPAEIRQRAGLSSARTPEDVCELEQALVLLIQRKGAINTAQVERYKTAHALLNKEAEDIPPIILLWGQGIISGALRLFAEEERERLEQMPTREQGLLVWADADLITPEVQSQLPAYAQRIRTLYFYEVFAQSLLSKDNLVRLEKEGVTFHKQLQQRAALTKLLAEAKQGNQEAKNTLCKLIKMQRQGESPAMFPWWGAKDNFALLKAYHERGLYLHGGPAFKHSKLQFAADLIEDSHTTVNFTVQISYCSEISKVDCSFPGTRPAGEPKVTVWWAAYQRDEFVTFVIDQLGLLISGLMDPVIMQQSLELIAQMDRQLEPWKDGMRQRKRHIDRRETDENMAPGNKQQASHIPSQPSASKKLKSNAECIAGPAATFPTTRPVLTSASQHEHMTAPTMPNNSVPPCRPLAPQHGSHQEQGYMQFDLPYISQPQHCGHQPGQQLISHQQRRQQLLSHQQPRQQLLSHQQPRQQLMSHQQLRQQLISHWQPSQQLIGHSQPSQASDGHQQYHLQQQLSMPAVNSLPLPTIPVQAQSISFALSFHSMGPAGVHATPWLSSLPWWSTAGQPSSLHLPNQVWGLLTGKLTVCCSAEIRCCQQTCYSASSPLSFPGATCIVMLAPVKFAHVIETSHSTVNTRGSLAADSLLPSRTS